jgi:hypothetical protein
VLSTARSEEHVFATILRAGESMMRLHSYTDTYSMDYGPWKRWFAWRPVMLTHGHKRNCMVWLRYIAKQRCHTFTGRWAHYILESELIYAKMTGEKIPYDTIPYSPIKG